MHKLYSHIFKIWRKRRFALFLRVIQPLPSDLLLDVGGFPGFWTSQAQPVQRIDSVNLDPVSWDTTSAPNHNIRALVGDGCALGFADRSYDIGFSNSVIEHVGPWERQQLFASEIRRVADALWVQTPAYECFFEPHYMAPFIHYLPPQLQRRLMRWCTLWGWVDRPSQERIDQMVETTRLLRKREVEELFPDCQIITERMFGIIPKSYIAFRIRGSRGGSPMS